MKNKIVLFLIGLLSINGWLFAQDQIIMQPQGSEIKASDLSLSTSNLVGVTSRTVQPSYTTDIQLYNGTVKLLSTETTNSNYHAQGYVFTHNSITQELSLSHTEQSGSLINIAKLGVRVQMPIYIGSTGKRPAAAKLAVDGTIKARSLILNPVSWADFVFDDNYQLRSLEQVEQYIQQNKHLPDVPAAQQVEQEGADLAETDAILLRKIEELTLYVIEQEKVLLRQQTLIEELEKHRKQNALETHK